MQQRKQPKNPANPSRHTLNKHKAYQEGGDKDKNGYKNFTLSPAQLECQKVIQNNIITFIEGIAGGGKSLVALYCAVKTYLADPSSKIIVIRTPMEATLHDKVGFLPNDLKAKLDPHFASTKLLLEQLLNPSKVDADLNGPHKRIEFLVPNFALGCTFDNAFIIVDECFTEKHELLTTEGWKNVRDISESDSVCQYNEDGSSEFVKPLRVIHKPYQGNIVEYSIGDVSYSVTENHRMVYKNQYDELTIKLAKDSSSTVWKFLTSSFQNSEEFPITDSLIKLAVCLQADGNCQVPYQKPIYQIQISRENKISRFKTLMAETGKFHQVKNNENKSRFYEGDLVLDLLDNTPNKNFNFENLLKLSLRQKQLFIRELAYWDGSFYNKGNLDNFLYTSTNKYNIDCVQAICSLCGYNSRLSTIVDERKDSYKTQYKLTIKFKNGEVTTQKHDQSKTISNYNGNVHCVTVPSGMVLTRCEDRVHVSGNCQTMNPVIMKLLLERIGTNSKMVVLGDPSQVYSSNKDRQGMRDAMLKFFNVDAKSEIVNSKYPDIGYYKFSIDDCMRSDIVKTVLRAYANSPLGK